MLHREEESHLKSVFHHFLPLLRDQAHSVATVKHVMDKIREIVAFLNPSQVPIIAADQPIYAVAKKVQWHWPEFYGEDKFVIMFGGLHIEMAALKSIGTLLRDSGWDRSPRGSRDSISWDSRFISDSFKHH